MSSFFAEKCLTAAWLLIIRPYAEAQQRFRLLFRRNSQNGIARRPQVHSLEIIVTIVTVVTTDNCLPAATGIEKETFSA